MHDYTTPRAFVRILTVAVLTLVTLLVAAEHGPAAADAPLLADRGVTAEICALMNEERRAQGLRPLTEAAEVDSVAVARVLDMASTGYFAHESPSGTNAVQLLRAGGVSWVVAGENIGRSDGYALTEAIRVIHRAWMASTGHRDNVLDPRFTRVGIAAAIAGTTYFVVVFAD
jgi:uncharacterized protein YkwD